MQNQIINSERAPEAVGAYPHARRIGNMLYLSGVGPRQRGTKAIPGVTLDAAGNIVEYDIEKQTVSVFHNVAVILEDAGAEWSDIIDVQVYLTNMKKDFPTFNRLYAEHFTSVQACRTTIEVGSLPTPIAVELKVVAYISGKKNEQE